MRSRFAASAGAGIKVTSSPATQLSGPSSAAISAVLARASVPASASTSAVISSPCTRASRHARLRAESSSVAAHTEAHAGRSAPATALTFAASSGLPSRSTKWLLRAALQASSRRARTERQVDCCAFHQSAEAARPTRSTPAASTGSAGRRRGSSSPSSADIEGKRSPGFRERPRWSAAATRPDNLVREGFSRPAEIAASSAALVSPSKGLAPSSASKSATQNEN